MPLAPRIPFQWADQAYLPGRMYLINTALRPPQLSIKKGRQCRTVGLGGRGGGPVDRGQTNGKYVTTSLVAAWARVEDGRVISSNLVT